MAFNPYPINYQPAQIYYPQAQQQAPAPTQQQNSSSIIWVQGEAGAKSYLVAPNTTVQLWDSEDQVIYLKSADASGMPSMKILEYTVKSDNSTSTSVSPVEDKYISKEEFESLQRKITAIQSDIEKIKNAKRKKEVDDDE